jgi:hypothetical protein
MSVLVIVRLQADPAKIQQLWKDRGSEFEAVMVDAKAAGATSHRWGLGDGEVVGIDVWPDAASFQSFFDSNTRIPALLQEAGVEGAPDVQIFDAPDAPDVF